MVRGLFGFWLRLNSRLGVFEIDFPDAWRLDRLSGTIIAPNHPSLLDAVILLSMTPNTVCIMRANLMRSPFLGGAAQLAGFVTNDSGPALIRQGVEKIHAGENLLIFPEGTRTGDGPVNAFKNGFALIAARTGAPIQTVFIEREQRYLGKGIGLFTPAHLPIRYRLHLGDLIHPGQDENAHDLTARLESYFAGRLENTGEQICLRQPLS